MKQITEDYCSFETAKLLKEKGFDEYCGTAYTTTEGYPIRIMGSTYSLERNSDYDEFHYSMPSQSLALKWLREVHKLDIDISIEYKNSKKVYYYSVLKKTVIRDIDCLHSETNFDSYEQATEAALKYTLENLI